MTATEPLDLAHFRNLLYSRDPDHVLEVAWQLLHEVERLTERERREIAQAHRGEVTPDSGVPLEPWHPKDSQS